MKRIMTAMGNETLNNELRKYAKYDVIAEDFICQDFLMSQLPKVELDVVVISGLLQGRWHLEEFIEKIQSAHPQLRIIVVTDEIDETTRQILLDKHVLDIFLDSRVEIQDIIDAIDREETMKKKYEMVSEGKGEYFVSSEESSQEGKEQNVSTPIEKWKIEKAVQKQEIIAVSGVPRGWEVYGCS